MSYLRLPHLHDDLLCFVAEDDLWLAPLDAPGRAWRLTVDRAKLGHPRFSPDGRHLAYTSWRTLVPEVHLAEVDGGPGRRLTHWGSADTRVCGWTPEGEILAVASHGEPFSFFTWGYKVPLDGAPGRKLPWGPVSDIQAADLDGERRTLLLTGTPPHEPASWKRYRGGATGRLWLHGERLLAGLDGHLHSPMFVGGRIAFLSDHEGVGNLYSCACDGSDLRRHTDHDAFYARHASSDGTRVVYQCAGDLWLVDDLSPDSAPRRLDVEMGGPRAGRRPYQVAAAQHLDGISVDETGRASAVVVRGSLYWLTHRDGPARTLTDTPGVRVRMPEMLGASGRVAYVTDAEGEDAIEIASLPRASGAREPRRLAPGALGRVRELVSDPEGERLAVASHDGRLLLIDVTEDSGGEVTELIRSINGPVRDLAFSPDGAWLTWSHPGIGRTLRQIKMARVEEGVVIDVTNGRFEDENPVFTRDGRYLAFLSWRGFDPVYDVHTGDLSFPLGCRPYLVPLSSATPSPFAVNPEGRPAAGGLDPVEDDDNGDSGTVTVEAEGLESRVTPFPVAASKYSALHPVAGGGLVWLRWPISGALGETFANPDDTSGRPTLEHFGITKAKRTELVDHLDWFAVSGDGSRLVVVDEGELRAVPAVESGDADSTVWIDARRILHVVDPAAEWRQAYEEAGRLIRAYFWEPGMCGIDWAGVLDQYRPLVERVASPDEFADLLREVLGELGTSHAYVTAARRNEGPPHYQRRQGLLGANFVRRDGGWTVLRILAGDSSDSKARSPLAGTGIREGAVLTHVDGRPVDPAAGPYPLLAGAGGTTVELTFTPAESAGPPRRVAVVPLVDERPLRYQDWVAKRRAVVRELSGGRCGYLHIPDMGGSGWAQFNRDLRMEVSRPALIVDVRGNAGGHISELVIETLSRTILGWDLTRDAQPVSYTSNAPRGPVVALADEATSSDGDMITAAFKLLKLGPVVGQRTWGGVVGMTGRHELGDGTVITVPMNAAWFDAYGWSVENRGVAPDIDVLRTPLDWAEGRHAQLTDAVELALGLLESNPAAVPPTYSDVPDHSRPKLPPRP
ncbi:MULTISPECIES: S41 family peptidase [Streptomyces]|uniref:Tricorn protease homolog n=1 Tax=Streptomyces koelreuteriae TaxID=2838015 RepID=A0ABX8FVG3_9ACTN|nr:MULTISPECIES: S41 family peptidase [Streptomyces]QWB25051.1 PDZ domain-containing protein [Streptomyces koelreuteriae]UUA08084.1 S41 family peptidase [Streptomyces koelreuteriae]UUA15691.1 S41 family peptidase [Streptomyces sp. CRCS-T-1]